MSNGDDPKAGLNPGLKARQETTHDTLHSTPPPAESASVTHADKGRGWSAVWLLVVIAGLLVTIWLVLF